MFRVIYTRTGKILDIVEDANVALSQIPDVSLECVILRKVHVNDDILRAACIEYIQRYEREQGRLQYMYSVPYNVYHTAKLYIS